MSDFSLSVAIDSPQFSLTVQLQSSVMSYKKIVLEVGAIDGNNKVFTWQSVPLQVFRNGTKLVEDAVAAGYALDDKTTTLTEAPQPGDSLEAYGN